MKKIAFVATGYIRKYDGISVYTENLLQEFLNLDASTEYTIDVYTGNDVLQLLQDRIVYEPRETIRFIGVNDSAMVKKIASLTALLYKNGKYDVIFMTNFMPTIFMPAKTLKVIHDFSVNLLPHLYSRGYRFYHDMLLKYAYYCDHAIGYISNTTKDDLNKFHGINEENKKLVYMPNGIPFKVKNLKRPEISYIEEKFSDSKLDFLVVGRINNHKGVDRVLEFCRYFDNSNNVSAFETVRLHFVGKQTEETQALFASLALKNIEIIFHGFMDDAGLNALYKTSHFCFFLSRNEGYGLPLVEAMWLRCFPLVSNIPIFNEILGVTIDKFDEQTGYGDAIEKHILSLCNSKDLRQLHMSEIDKIIDHEHHGYLRSAQNLVHYINTEV